MRGGKGGFAAAGAALAETRKETEPVTIATLVMCAVDHVAPTSLDNGQEVSALTEADRDVDEASVPVVDDFCNRPTVFQLDAYPVAVPSERDW